MAKTRRRLRNENAHLRAEVARLQAEAVKLKKKLNPPRSPYIRDALLFGGGGVSNSYQASLDFLSAPKSQVVMAEDGALYGNAPAVAEIDRIQAFLNEANDNELFRKHYRLMRVTVTAETTPAQKGESDVHK